MKTYSVFVSADQVDVRYLKVNSDDMDEAPRSLVEDGDYEETWGFQLRLSDGNISVRDAAGNQIVPSVAISSSGCKINVVDGSDYNIGDGEWLDVNGVIRNEDGTYAVIEDWESGGQLELTVCSEGMFDISKLGFTVSANGGYLIAVSYEDKPIKVGDSWGAEDEEVGTEPTSSYDYIVAKPIES